MSLTDVKREVAVASRVLARTGLCSGVTESLGHVSMRAGEGPAAFVVKGRGYAVDALAAMREQDMVACDADGAKVDGPPEASPCYEVKIHACLYRARPEVNAVVHAHPRFTIVMSVLGGGLVPLRNEGRELIRSGVPVWPHCKLVASEQDGQSMAAAMGGADAVILAGHGAVTAGPSVSAAVMTMLQLEEQARMNYLALCARGGAPGPGIPDALADEARDAPPFWELPHLAASIAPGASGDALLANSGQAGPYTYWASQVQSPG